LLNSKSTADAASIERTKEGKRERERERESKPVLYKSHLSRFMVRNSEFNFLNRELNQTSGEDWKWADESSFNSTSTADAASKKERRNKRDR
jgi:hypothetical protein